MGELGAKMARLLIKSEGFREHVIELRLGCNRLGRGPENDFQLEHPTISGHHCEIDLGGDELVIRDCNSTNGTFIGGKPIKEATLQKGQTLRLGDVELFVETTEFKIAIPEIEVPRPAPPVVLSDGSLICPRHPKAMVTHQCTKCHEVMCDACVHRLRRRGGKLWLLCPVCSNKVEPLGGEKKKKKSFLGFLQKTVKLPFVRSSKRAEE